MFIYISEDDSEIESTLNTVQKSGRLLHDDGYVFRKVTLTLFDNISNRTMLTLLQKSATENL